MSCKQQQKKDPEHRENDSSAITMVKSKVNVHHYDQEVRDGFSKECYAVKDCTMYEEKFGLRSRHDCCSGSLRPLLVPSWFLVFSGFPGARCLLSVFACGFCSESADS